VFSAKSLHSSFAWSRTVSVAFCCRSGRYLYFLSNLLTSTLSFACTLSLSVQSTVTFFRNRPEKGSRARTIKVQEATIARLQSVDRKYEPYIFNPNPNAHTVQFQKLRAKVCRLNPGEADRLTQIHIHTFRYGFAHRLMKQLKPQKEVQQKLNHKSSASTDRYTNTVVFNDLDWETSRGTTVEEAEALGKIGYTKYDVIGEVHLYRRLKA